MRGYPTPYNPGEMYIDVDAVRIFSPESLPLYLVFGLYCAASFGM